MRFLISSSLVEILSDSCVFHQKLFAMIAQPVQHLRKNKRRYEADKNVTVLRTLLSVSTLDYVRFLASVEIFSTCWKPPGYERTRLFHL